VAVTRIEITMGLPIQVVKSSVTASFCRKASSIDLAHHARLFAILLSTIYMLCMTTTLLAQTQLGVDIDGETAYDEFGQSVSLSSLGNHLAIGAPKNNGNGFDSGHVRVYQWSDAAWTQLGADIDGEAAYDEAGQSVALSSDGTRLAIGAHRNDGNGIDSGHVRVYHWSGAAWTQLGADINGEAFSDFSGWSVSLSSDGNRLAIGAPFNVGGNGYDSGHVRVYQWSGAAWTQLGADIDGEAAYDESGWSVSLSSDGNRLAIGAAGNDGNGINSGHVRVFQWSGAAWTQLGADINGEAFSDFSGWSVSLSSDGNRLAVGAPFNVGSNGYDSGHVRVYQWSGVAWTQLGADIDGEAAYDNFGSTVSLASNGNRLAVGAPLNSGSNGIDSGQVRVFQWSDGTWTQLGTDIEGEAAYDNFGSAVSLASNGNRLAIGASGNDGNGFDSGHVRIFDVSMFNTFSLNAGLNDAWYYPITDGQGFFITVFPDLGLVSLAWFTYDTELPAEDAQANLGDAGHRWLTALGPIDGDQAVMNITMTSGGIFDTPGGVERTYPPGSDGTITLTFDSCSSGTVEYDIPSIGRQGIIPIQRIANDNIIICEALNAD